MAAAERQIQTEILDWLKEQGIFHRRVNTQGIRGPNGRKCKNPMAGMPDIQGLMPDGSGRAFHIEVKTPDGKLSELQEQTIYDLETEGALVIVAHSLDDVIPFLKIKSFAV